MWRRRSALSFFYGSPSRDGGNLKNGYAVGKSLENLYLEVKSAVERNTFALTIGGDHSLGAGSLAGVLSVRPETGVIWVDAHADLNSPDTSPSGNAHGMPLSMVTQGIYDWSRLPGFEWLKDVPLIDPEQIVFVGLRDIDTEEREIQIDAVQSIRRGRSPWYWRRYGKPSPTLKVAFHMSYDIDAD